MDQTQRRKFLIEYLLAESNAAAHIPNAELEQKRLLRALFNIRMPKGASSEFISVQDEYLREELLRKGVTDISELTPVATDIYLWQGDITTLRCDGIVNAANSQLLGCFCPNHCCIDNAIHTFAGIGLRQECARLMAAQGHEEPVGQAKITSGYALPCKYVLHTVGPTVYGQLTKAHEQALADCYLSCMALAERSGLTSLAFCCISTGEFRFPNERAAQIAVKTVLDRKRETGSAMKIIFNVFKDRDYEIYAKLLGIDTSVKGGAR